MRTLSIIATSVFVLTAAVVLAEPAFALFAAPAPAPVAGLGFGALVLIGSGYRALKRRIDR